MFPDQVLVLIHFIAGVFPRVFSTLRVAPIVSRSVSPSLSNDEELAASGAAVTLLISLENLRLSRAAAGEQPPLGSGLNSESVALVRAGT